MGIIVWLQRGKWEWRVVAVAARQLLLLDHCVNSVGLLGGKDTAVTLCVGGYVMQLNGVCQRHGDFVFRGGGGWSGGLPAWVRGGGVDLTTLLRERWY